MPDSVARILRTLLQLLAGGAFTVIFDQIVRDVPSSYQPYLVAIFTLLVTTAQNAVEQKTGHAILKPSNQAVAQAEGTTP